MGFRNLKITRGNVSFVFTGEDQEIPGHLFVLNHDKKTLQDFCEPPGENYEQQIEDALNYLFAHDICSHLPLGGPDHTLNLRRRRVGFHLLLAKKY